MKRIFGLAALAATMLMSTTASAHHSFAMFDRNKEVELKNATVVKWEWTNPHTWLYITVPNGTSNPDKYSIEGGNPGMLRRTGFGVGTFKPGDKVTVFMMPLLNGQKGGAMTAVVTANGKTFGSRLAKMRG